MEVTTPEEIFRYCLENPDNFSHEQLLAKFPQHRAELETSLLLDRRLAESLPQRLTPSTHDSIKRRLMLAAEVGKPVGVPLRLIIPKRQPAWTRRIAWAAATLAIAVGSLWLLAARSLPDNPLYGIKLATEDLLVSASSEAAGLVRGHIGLANTRLVDLRTMNEEGKLGQAEASLSNYGRHLQSGVSTWRTLQSGAHLDLDKLLYASSVAGKRTLGGFDDVVQSLPEPFQATITQTLADLGTLTDESTQKLQAAGVNLDQTLREAGGELGSLLAVETAPSPSPAPTPRATALANTAVPSTIVATPLSTSTPAATSSASPNAEAARLDVLYSAQTVIANGGSVETPVVAAAETVIADIPGTPLAQAQQTVISARSTVSPIILVTITPTPP